MTAVAKNSNALKKHEKILTILAYLKFSRMILVLTLKAGIDSITFFEHDTVLKLLP